jgi:tRNA(fMet)-specific endonuclease VapC
MKYLLDTNVLSEPVKNAPQKTVLKLIKRHEHEVDGQIASIAKLNGLILVTRNTDDFKKFSQLKLQNWHRK